MDLATLAVREVVREDGGLGLDGLEATVRSNVAFWPADGRLLYARASSYERPCEVRLVAPSGGREEVALHEADSFGYVDDLAPLPGGGFLFSGTSPADPRLRARLAALGLSPHDRTVWRARPGGGLPEYAFPALGGRGGRPGVPASPALGEATASGDGTLYAVARSPREPTDRRTGRFQYEVVRVSRDGRALEPLTGLRGLLRSAAASRDGSAVAFASAPDRRGLFEPWLLDTRTGAVDRMDLLDQPGAHPDVARG